MSGLGCPTLAPNPQAVPGLGVTSPQAMFLVCGHWPGAQPQAFLEKMEGEAQTPATNPKLQDTHLV